MEIIVNFKVKMKDTNSGAIIEKTATTLQGVEKIIAKYEDTIEKEILILQNITVEENGNIVAERTMRVR